MHQMINIYQNNLKNRNLDSEQAPIALRQGASENPNSEVTDSSGCLGMKDETVAYLKNLRETIISAFEAFEPQARFVRTPWEYKKGSGGGEMAVLRGSVFEKAAVNISVIHGDQFPMSDGIGPFFATGISLITHMQNPHAPTVHFNIRFIETEKKLWFGGGYDLTPMGFPFAEDTAHFHRTAQEALDSIDTTLYSIFTQNAKEYFYIPHREKERGVGGIFFDHYNSGDYARDYALFTHIGNTFLDAILPIYHKRVHLPFTEEEKRIQATLRAHYVEFNLLYDRGTKFGFASQGNPEAILCSLPPVASW